MRMTAYASPAMNLLHDERDRVGRRLGDDAVPEIEDVPRPAARAVEHLPDLATEDIARREQSSGIEVPLDSLAALKPGPGDVEGNAPVDADHVPAGRGEVLEKGARPRAEVDDRNVRRGGERQRRAAVGQHVFAVLRGRQAPH